MLWFTSDLHFSSDNIFNTECRPYSNREEHATGLLNNINNCVDANDTLYIVGDAVQFTKDGDYMFDYECLKQIKCHKVLIMGNHEYRLMGSVYNAYYGMFCSDIMEKTGIEEVHSDLHLEVSGKHFYLNHFPSQCTPSKEVINLYGHVHRAGGLYSKHGFNVGVDNHNYKPFSIPELAKLVTLRDKYWCRDFELNNLR